MSERERMRWLGLAIGQLIGASVAFFMLTVAFDHNPQEEFWSRGAGVDLPYAFLLFSSWYVPVAGLIFAIAYVASFGLPKQN